MRTPTDEREVLVSMYTYKPDGTRNDRTVVYTSDYSYMAKFDKFCEQYPEHWKCIKTMKRDGDVVGKRYDVAVECVFFRGKPRQGTTQTEEQKAAFAERMRKAREEGKM